MKRTTSITTDESLASLRRFATYLDRCVVVSKPSNGSRTGIGDEMTTIATKVKVGIASCAVAASASLIPIATADAAPVQAPASPVLLDHGSMPQHGWWMGGRVDLLRFFAPRPFTGHTFFFHGLFNCWGPYGHRI